MKLISLSSALALFGAISHAAGAPLRLEGVRPLSGSTPESWAHEVKSTWHAHVQGGPGKYSGAVLDKVNAAGIEAIKRESTDDTKAQVRPAGSGGGMPPSHPWKKREEGKTVDAQSESAEDGGPRAAINPPTNWRRHIGDEESADEEGSVEARRVDITPPNGW
ncbi:hypothetical protein FRB90_004727 [Tulasnella sp. 427]|nr:hypothetical protein FRB90_004727 [Tulasnella sp. 427]